LNRQDCGLSPRRLHDLSEEIRHTVVDVRRLVEGLRLPALGGLGQACWANMRA
jgi:hypothetical protein